jgi:hypothetical protein
VDLVADNYIGVFPQTIFASLMTSTAASALTVLLGLLSFYSRWCLVLATAMALVSYELQLPIPEYYHSLTIHLYDKDIAHLYPHLCSLFPNLRHPVDISPHPHLWPRDR